MKNKYIIKAVKNIYYEVEVEADNKEDALLEATCDDSKYKRESKIIILENATFKIKNI